MTQFVDAPKIEQKEQDVSVIEAIQFSLQCENEADPTADVTWQPPRDEPTIAADPGGQGTRGYRIIGSTLIVERSDVRRHFGEWSCTACNKHGCDTASKQVTVQGESLMNFVLYWSVCFYINLVINCTVLE